MKSALKSLLLVILTITCAQVSAQKTLKKIWATDTTLRVPESVLADKGILYVSLIDGGAWAKDGKGGVGKVSTDGKIINTQWITGLNAPKGLARYGDRLYVADLDELVIVSISGNKISGKIKIDGAAKLNDVTADKNGVVYVSDSEKGTVFKVEHDKPMLYLENLRGVNGLKAVGDKLYILTGDGMYVADEAKQLTKICALENGGDGIEPIGNGDFLVTAWVGYVYYVKADGTKEILLDTHATNNKTADIGYDAVKKIVYIPTFLGNSIMAYQLQ